MKRSKPLDIDIIHKIEQRILSSGNDGAISDYLEHKTALDEKYPNQPAHQELWSDSVKYYTNTYKL